MERIIATDIINYMLQNKLLNKHQHGFLAKKCTLTNLLESTNDWSLSIENKNLQTALYIDFSKAFDSVSTVKLVQKLRSYDIAGDLLSVIKDFLSDRTQKNQSRPAALRKFIADKRSCAGVLSGAAAVFNLCQRYF